MSAPSITEVHAPTTSRTTAEGKSGSPAEEQRSSAAEEKRGSTASGKSATRTTKTQRRIGRIVTVVPVAFLLWDGVIKLLNIDPVVESFARLGYPEGIGPSIGLVEVACLACYAVPRSSALGAILLTGYLGGAVATHARVGDPLVSHSLFPVYVGVLLWAGLFLREARLRTLLPLRRR